MSARVRRPAAPLWVALFFACLLAVGSFVFRDYGVSWDEVPTREFGIMYATHQVPDLPALESLRLAKGVAWERHGPAFEIALVAMEQAVGFGDIRSVFFARHLATFFVFFSAVLLFYGFCRQRFGDWLALFGAACLVLTPTVFAHAFYNTKDIPFFALFIAGMWSLSAVLARPTWPRIMVHAVLTALLVSTRVLGLLALGFTLILLASRHRTRRTVLQLAAYVVCVALLLPVFWPVLRIDYWGVFAQAVLNAGSNTLSPRSVLLWGADLSPRQLPWYYVPSWMLVTIPLPYLLLATVGAMVAARRIREAWREMLRAPGQDVVVAVWLLVPLIMTMVMKPVLYDGWRHMFFIYPAVLYLAVGAAAWLWRLSHRWLVLRSPGLRAAAALFAVSACLTPAAMFMVASHPFEHLYFNRMAGADLATARLRFDFDYWGLSYRPMLERLVALDSSRQIKLRVENFPGVANAIMLAPADRQRLRFARSIREADYYITNFRFRDEPTPAQGEIFSLQVGGATVAALYRCTPGGCQ